MLPPDALSEKPSFTTKTARFRALLCAVARTPFPPREGGVESMVAVNVTATLARTNIITLVMMSRNGMMLSSPASSPSSTSFGWERRRTLDRCAALSASGIGDTESVRGRSVRDGEQVEDSLHRPLEVVLNVLGARVQDDVRDHASHRDAEPERRIVHGLCNSVRQDALLVGLREALRGDGGGGVDQTGHRAEQ